jgi:hypothetical protein
MVWCGPVKYCGEKEKFMNSEIEARWERMFQEQYARAAAQVQEVCRKFDEHLEKMIKIYSGEKEK